ncbi:MAG: hypothetical protein K8T20_09300 [Planctomycetes bacterium]|nr:hypothetical protein [Planctomycetota bacterium]
MCCLSSSRCSGLLSWFASWVVFPICPLISAPLAAISLVRGLRGGSAMAITRATLLSPFVLVTAVTAFHTTLGYTHGVAYLHPDVRVACCGAPSPYASWSVDPRSRLPVIAEPARNGASRFMWRVNDRMARMLVRILGPQKGSWTGALPTAQEAGSALAKGKRASSADFLAVPDLTCFANRSKSPIEIMAGFTLVPGANPTGKTFMTSPWNNLTLLGTGPDFFVVLDPTGREVARFGDPAR